MFEIQDETDKFTGERSITALLQEQEMANPRIHISASIAGHQHPALTGTGSYILSLEWVGSESISGLAGLLGLAPESATEEFNMFHCLIDGEPVDFEGTAISKHPSEYGEVLLLIISATPEVLDRISSANNVECRAYQCEFALNQDVRSKVGEVLSLTGKAKTYKQSTDDLIERAESNLKSAEVFGQIVGLAVLAGFIYFMYQMLT